MKNEIEIEKNVFNVTDVALNTLTKNNKTVVLFNATVCNTPINMVYVNKNIFNSNAIIDIVFELNETYHLNCCLSDIEIFINGKSVPFINIYKMHNNRKY